MSLGRVGWRLDCSFMIGVEANYQSGWDGQKSPPGAIEARHLPVNAGPLFYNHSLHLQEVAVVLWKE
jgi:hypothetical protein